MPTEMQAVAELTKENFASSIDGHPFAVVDFWAPWCGPCRAFAPVFAAAASRHPDVLFAKVNTEDEQDLAAQFGIRSIPTLMIFRDNIIVFAQAGALSASALDQVLAAAKDLDMDAVRREVAAQTAAAKASADAVATAATQVIRVRFDADCRDLGCRVLVRGPRRDAPPLASPLLYRPAACLPGSKAPIPCLSPRPPTGLADGFGRE